MTNVWVLSWAYSVIEVVPGVCKHYLLTAVRISIREWYIWGLRDLSVADNLTCQSRNKKPKLNMFTLVHKDLAKSVSTVLMLGLRAMQTVVIRK